MQIKDLEAVDAVYRYRSFSEAAFRTSFSISAISKQIARVENELGVTLFLRKTKSSELAVTELGERIIPVMQSMLDSYANLQYIIKSSSESEEKHLTVGCTPLIGTIGESKIISDLLQEDPSVQLELVSGKSNELMGMLMAGKLDAVFILMFNVNTTDLPLIEAMTNEDVCIVQTMRNRHLYIGMRADHPLARKERISIQDVKGETFLFSSDLNSDQYDTRIGALQKLVDGADHAINARYVDFSNRDIVLSLVENGNFLLPQVVLPLTGGHNIRYVEVENWPDEAGGLFVCRSSNHSGTLKRLLHHVREYANREGITKGENLAES